MIILGTPWDFLQIPGTSWESLGLLFPGNPWDFLGIPEASGVRGTSWQSLGIPANVWESLGLQKTVLQVIWFWENLKNFGLFALISPWPSWPSQRKKTEKHRKNKRILFFRKPLWSRNLSEKWPLAPRPSSLQAPIDTSGAPKPLPEAPYRSLRKSPLQRPLKKVFNISLL